MTKSNNFMGYSVFKLLEPEIKNIKNDKVWKMSQKKWSPVMVSNNTPGLKM